jgi:predicted N-acyltransferase
MVLSLVLVVFSAWDGHDGDREQGQCPIRAWNLLVYAFLSQGEDEWSVGMRFGWNPKFMTVNDASADSGAAIFH